MGSCCGCCSKKPKAKAKTKKLITMKREKTVKKTLSAVASASLRTSTVSGVPVNPKIKLKPFTSKQLGSLKNNPKLDSRVRRIASPPFSDFTKITAHLFLTGFWGLSKENIDNNHIKCIISTAHELPKFQFKGIDCIRLPVEDSNKEDLSIYFNEISDKINTNSNNNRNTVVHCMAGARRSFTFVIAYLMKYRKMNLKTAFTHVYKKRRITVGVNAYFFQQLITFEYKLFAKNSVKMITIEGQNGLIPDFVAKEFPELCIAMASEDTQEETLDDTSISIISL